MILATLPWSNEAWRYRCIEENVLAGWPCTYKWLMEKTDKKGRSDVFSVRILFELSVCIFF